MEMLEHSEFEYLALRNVLASSPWPTSPPYLMPRRSASLFKSPAWLIQPLAFEPLILNIRMAMQYART